MKYYRARTIAAALDVSKNTIINWCNRGLIDFVKDPNSEAYMISLDSFIFLYIKILNTRPDCGKQILFLLSRCLC